MPFDDDAQVSRKLDKRTGPLRVVCLLCGKEIPGPAQIAQGRAVPVLIYRDGEPAGTGFAHRDCAGSVTAHDLTGKPDFSGYNEDSSQPAYDDERTPQP